MSGLETVIVSLAMAALTFDHRHPFTSKSFRVETMADYQHQKRTEKADQQQEEQEERSHLDFYGEGDVSDRRRRSLRSCCSTDTDDEE
jgi:hypothetical protein